MKLSVGVRSALTLIVVMFLLLFALAAAGANFGPVELLLWLVILIIGLILVRLGTRRSSTN